MSNAFVPPAGASPYGPAPGVHAGMPVKSVTQPQPAQAAAPDDRITVGPLILSYPNLFVPRENKLAKPDPTKPPVLQYSAEFICYNSFQTVAEIYQKLHQAAEAVCRRELKCGLEGLRNQPLRSLAEKKTPAAEPGFFFSANTQSKPGVLKGNPPEHVVDPEELYAGCFVYANITPSAYDVDLSRGIKWYLNSVWKVSEGPRLAPERNPMEHYAHLLGQVPVNLAQPQHQAPPQQQAPPGYGQPPVQGYAAPAYGQPPQGYAQPPAAQAPPQMPGYWVPPADPTTGLPY